MPQWEETDVLNTKFKIRQTNFFDYETTTNTSKNQKFIRKV